MNPTSTATPPEALRSWTNQHPRREAIQQHGFSLNLAWWNNRILHLRGGPVAGADGREDWIDRGHLFAMAQAARDDETGGSALQLLWSTLAWGTGTNHRNSPRRIASIEARPDHAGLLLRDAARLSVTDPRGAFLLLQPGRNAIGFLGPNFFTKFLYFAGGGEPSHPCLIVDNRVLVSLFRETGNSDFAPRTTNYGVEVYESALSQMVEWAEGLSHAGRTVGPDEVERWAFSAGGRRG
ncbi:hypothetical protein [Arthrobacter sp. 92]|uniref:8-oxoguanine DNA glycosylase OGG fold protein n=1 Tax=Arthrobacter sp. 92 TaxID=3418175 RepID=UPI003D08F8AB